MARTPHLDRTNKGPNVPAAIVEHAETHPGTSLTFLKGSKEGRICTYKDVSDEMLRRGQNLLELGLKKGDRLAIILPNPDDFVLSFLGALAVGIVPVPMYPPLSMGKLDAYIDGAANILESAGARMLLTDSKMQTILWSLVDRVDTIEGLVTVDALESDIAFATTDIDHIDLDDTAFLQFTSGSTSNPKGVVVTHRSLLANLDGIMNVGLEISPEDVAVSWLPLYHDMGLIGFMLAPIWYAVPTIYIPTLDFIKRPSRWMTTIDKYRGSIAFAPNFAYALAARRTKPELLESMDLSCVKVLGCGAEPNHPETLRAFLDYFAPAGLKPESLLPCYGMAEATLAVTFIGLDEELKVDIIQSDAYHTDRLAKPLEDDAIANGVEFVCCGKAFPEHQVVIIDDAGKTLPERHVGQIVFRGPSVTPGYYLEPAKTDEVFTDEGLLTGDLGYIADGELYVTGRIKDIIILNGRNYDPQTIEWLVQEIPGVRKGNVVSFSRPAQNSEELVIVAEVKADQDNDALTETIATAVRSALGLNPADIVLVGPGQLPKTSSGKLQRRKTRDQYLAETLGNEGVRTAGANAERMKLAKHLAISAISQVRHRVKSGIRLVSKFRA